MSRFLRFVPIVLVLCFFPMRAAFAGDLYAAVHGTVTDPSGAVVRGASVTLLNESTGIASTRSTDRLGYYIFPQVALGGPYRVKICAEGFQPVITSGLLLNVNDNREVNAVLMPGPVSESVEVTAGALQVETSNTQMQQTVSGELLGRLPLRGRDAAGLQKLQPGAVESSDRLGTFAINGSQTAQNSYLLDGIDINDPMLQRQGITVSPDALAEQNIVASTMNAQYARNSGAVVNQILRSGTNEWHGSGFEFYRDTFMNNGDYFSRTRPDFHQNIFGGTIGGPLQHNRLFVFASYQGLRNRTAQTVLQTTMSPDQRAGDFTADVNYASAGSNSAGLTARPIPFQIGACAPGEAATWSSCFHDGEVKVPPSQWDPIAAALVKRFVLPANEVIDGVYYANFNALNEQTADQGILRADYAAGPQDSVWASTVIQSSPGTSTLSSGGGSFPGFGSMQANHFKLFSTSWTHTFGANMLSELRGSYFRNPFGATSPMQVVTPASAGFQINPQDPQSGLPYLSVGSYFNLGFSYMGPQPRLDTNMTFAENFTWVHNNHALRLGAQFEQFRVRNPFDVYNNGLYAFSGGGQYSSGDPLLDFVLGIPDLFYQSNNGFVDALAKETYAYAQDNWKVSPVLTLNYGFGWDAESPYQNRQFNGLGIICWQNSSSTSEVFAGGPPGLNWPADRGCNAAGSPMTRRDHFAPRVGFAWSPSTGPTALLGPAGTHQLSIRAGFGVYFNRDQEEQTLQNVEDPPFMFISTGAAAFGGSPSLANPYADVTGNGAMANPFPMAPVTANSSVQWLNYLPLQLAAFSPAYGVPYTYNYNLNVQRGLGSKRIAQIGYVGSVSHRLATWYEGDPITPAGHAACLAMKMCAGNSMPVHLFFPQFTAQPATVEGNPFGLPFGTPYYVSVGEQDTEGSSNYNALQASLLQAPSQGLQLDLAYTYAHAIDDGSGYENVVGRQGRVRNYVPGFESLNHGNSDFDARHRFSALYLYDIPAPSSSITLARALLKGWSVGGVTVFQTGFPVEIYQHSARSLWCDAYSYFGCPDVPQISAQRVATFDPRNASHAYFDRAAFSSEKLGTFGNTPRNFLHGPGFNYTNLQLAKRARLGPEGHRSIEFRLEAYNAFNHPNFASPSGNFDSSSFGQVTSVLHSADPNGDPSPGRAIQLSTHLDF